MIEIGTQHLGGGAEGVIAEWRGEPYEAASKHGALHALARKLVCAGCEDQPWRTSTLRGRSLHYLAATTIAEGDGAPRIAKWASHPHAMPDPMLDAAIAAVWDAMAQRTSASRCV